MLDPAPGVAGFEAGNLNTVSLELLAVAGDLAAYRRVTTAEGRERISAPCAYAGMDDPAHGVELGIMHLPSGETVAVWPIYVPPQRAEGCVPHAVSEARLRAAKASFGILGLAIERPPARERLDALGLEMRPPRQPTPAEVDGSVAQAALWRGDAELYTRVVPYNVIMAFADHEISFPHGYRVDSAYVVVECHVRTGGTGVTVRQCTFTPVLS